MITMGKLWKYIEFVSLAYCAIYFVLTFLLTCHDLLTTTKPIVTPFLPVAAVKAHSPPIPIQRYLLTLPKIERTNLFADRCLA